MHAGLLARHGVPVAPVGPVGPVAPVAPVLPAGPAGPAGPVVFQEIGVSSLVLHLLAAVTIRIVPIPSS
jgi:hypothetical protein